jgi:hypothetical protein
MSGFVEWGALADVVLVGLIVGAGLPALFALGVRALAGPGSRDDAGRRPRVRVTAAVACFAVVVGAISSAIVIIGNSKH